MGRPSSVMIKKGSLEGPALLGMAKRTNGTDNGWFDGTVGWRLTWRCEIPPHYEVPTNNAWTEVINSQLDGSFGVLDYFEVAMYMPTDGGIGIAVDWGLVTDGNPPDTFLSTARFGTWDEGLPVADYELICTVNGGGSHTYTLNIDGVEEFSETVTGKNDYPTPPANYDLRAGSSDCAMPLYSMQLYDADDNLLYEYIAGDSADWSYATFGKTEIDGHRDASYASPQDSFHAQEDFILAAAESFSLVTAGFVGTENAHLGANTEAVINSIPLFPSIAKGFVVATSSLLAGFIGLSPLFLFLSSGSALQIADSSLTDYYDILDGEHMIEFQIDKDDNKVRVYLDKVVVIEDDLNAAFNADTNFGPLDFFGIRGATYFSAMFRKKLSSTERDQIYEEILG